MSLNENANRDALIMKHQEAVKVLAAAKEAELAARKAVLTTVFNFDENVLRSGTENVELGGGYKLKAVFKINYSLDNTNEGVDKALTKIEKTGTEGKFIAERLVKWKPELSLSEYKQLPQKFKDIIDDVLKASEGTPSLELVEPKSK